MLPVRDIQDLRDRITASCGTTRCTPGIFERVRESMRRRVTACIQKNGEHWVRSENITYNSTVE